MKSKKQPVQNEPCTRYTVSIGVKSLNTNTQHL